MLTIRASQAGVPPEGALFANLSFVIGHLSFCKCKGQGTLDLGQMTMVEIAIQHPAAAPDTLAWDFIAGLLFVLI
ncbi:MAG: hypothetical protein Fur0025_04270 [Oscillatoriaceae cyanobacterium]